MSSAEAEAFLFAHNAAFARTILESRRLRQGMPHLASSSSSPDVPVPLDSTSDEPSITWEDFVTEGGEIGSASSATIEAQPGRSKALASWSAITEVKSGFARRVGLSVVGYYTQFTELGLPPVEHAFTDECGNSPLEAFIQKCIRGTVYFDADCRTGGVIQVSSQHSVAWRFVSSQLEPTGDIHGCNQPYEPTCGTNQVLNDDGVCVDPDSDGGGGADNSNDDPGSDPGYWEWQEGGGYYFDLRYDRSGYEMLEEWSCVEWDFVNSVTHEIADSYYQCHYVIRNLGPLTAGG